MVKFAGIRQYNVINNIEFDEKNIVNFRELPLIEDSFYESGSKFSP